MKNLIKKIGQNKFQFFFFVGLVSILVASVIVSVVTSDKKEKPIDDISTDVVKPDEPSVVIKPEESLSLPFDKTTEYAVVRKFYDKNSSRDDQKKSLIKYGNTYRVSSGTGFAKNDNTSFDVLASLSGTITEIKQNPLYGNYVVIEHNNKVKTHYYGLADVCVSIGTLVKQGEKIGTSGTTDIDKEAGNHVYYQVSVNDTFVNPENYIGKKISEIE